MKKSRGESGSKTAKPSKHKEKQAPSKAKFKINVLKEIRKIKAKAEEYASDKEKTKHLLKEAIEKARKKHFTFL